MILVCSGLALDRFTQILVCSGLALDRFVQNSSLFRFGFRQVYT
jgi:hypothetical protein